MIGGGRRGHPSKEEIETSFRRRKGKNLSKTRRPGPRGPTIPVSNLGLPGETDKAAGNNRQAGRHQQTDRREGGKEKLGERQANKETNKQRARQTKGPSARDRQTGERKPTGALLWCVPGWTQRSTLSVCPCQSGSLLECVSQDLWGLFVHWAHNYHFLGFFCSLQVSPCPVPVPSVSLSVVSFQ